MNREYRAYRRLYYILITTVALIFPFKTIGLQNIPDGPVVLCGNHSSNLDPILISLAAGKKHHIHYMAKTELFKVPIIASVIKAIGAFPVDRGNKDVRAIKTAMKYLKAGEKIGIFPEGTRAKKAGDKAAKSGAIRIADQMNVPIVPVYLPRRKKPFKRMPIEFGKPYYANPERRKISQEDYSNLAGELMDRINAMELKAAEEKR